MLSSSAGAEGTPLPVVMMVKLTSSVALTPALPNDPHVRGTAAGPEVTTPHGLALTDCPTTKVEGAVEPEVVKVMGVELADGVVFMESIEIA